MRKSLVLMFIMGLSATYVNATVDTMFQPTIIESFATISNATIAPVNTSYATVSNATRSLSANNVAKLGQTIEALSARAQDRENHLSNLAQRLTAKQEAATLFTTSLNNRSFTNVASSSPPAMAAARAARTAHSRTVGLCARYVRKALQSAGYTFTPNASAYQYATRGTLATAGFAKISNHSSSQVGDVVVYNRSTKHRHGHIQIFDGNNWVSDFRQSKKSPYSGNYSYTTWRDVRYMNDASNTGIYLAMDD